MRPSRPWGPWADSPRPLESLSIGSLNAQKRRITVSMAIS